MLVDLDKKIPNLRKKIMKPFIFKCNPNLVSVFALFLAGVAGYLFYAGYPVWGGIFVILNGSMKARKLRYILNDSGARVLISSTTKAKVVNDAIRNSGIEIKLIWVGEAARIPQACIKTSFMWDSLFNETSLADKERNLPEQIAGKPSCIDLDLATGDLFQGFNGMFTNPLVAGEI